MKTRKKPVTVNPTPLSAKPQQQPWAPSYERKIDATRRAHYAFSVMYGAIACFIVAAPIIGINFTTTFQSGALCFNVGLAFLLLSSTLIARRYGPATSDGEFLLFRDMAILIAITCVASIALTFFPLFNTMNILVNHCPEHHHRHDHHHHHQHQQQQHQIASSLPAVGLGIDLFGTYAYRDRAGASKQHVLHLQYNASERTLALRRAGEDAAPRAATENEPLQDLCREEVGTAVAPGGEPAPKRTRFHCLDRELRLLIEESATLTARRSGVAPRQPDGLLTGLSVYDDPVGFATSPEEDRVFLEQQIARICRNEYGFAVFWAVFLILLILLNLVTIGVYAWIKTAAAR